MENIFAAISISGVVDRSLQIRPCQQLHMQYEHAVYAIKIKETKGLVQNIVETHTAIQECSALRRHQGISW